LLGASSSFAKSQNVVFIIFLALYFFSLRGFAEFLTLSWLEVEVIYYWYIKQIKLDFRVTWWVHCKALFQVCKALDHRATRSYISLHCYSLISWSVYMAGSPWWFFMLWARYSVHVLSQASSLIHEAKLQQTMLATLHFSWLLCRPYMVVKINGGQETREPGITIILLKSRILKRKTNKMY